MINIDSQFILGTNATFTVSNDKGEHYTYKVRQPNEEMPFFVSLLSGADNESSFTYVGLVNPDLTVRLTKKSRFNDDSKPVRVLRWALSKVAAKSAIPEGYAIQHDGKCGCCGRKLTTPESLARGIGPECAKRLGA